MREATAAVAAAAAADTIAPSLAFAEHVQHVRP